MYYILYWDNVPYSWPVLNGRRTLFLLRVYPRIRTKLSVLVLTWLCWLRRYLQPYFHRSARAQRANLLQFTPILSAERMHFVRYVPANLKAGTFRRKCMRSGSDSTGTCSTGLYSVFIRSKALPKLLKWSQFYKFRPPACGTGSRWKNKN